MKKLLLTFFVAVVFSGLFSQSLELYFEGELLEPEAEITLIAHPDSGLMELHDIGVKNISIAAIDVKCVRTNIDTVAGSENALCWVVCYPAEVDTSVYSLIIEPQDTNYSFFGHYYPFGFEGITRVKYTFYDVNNIEDQVTFFANYDATGASGVDDINTNVVLSNAYPNPANKLVNFDYDMKGLNKGKVVIYNLLGSVVKDIEIPENYGSLKLNTFDLVEGIYFYSLLVNNEAVSTRKLIIKH